MTWDLAEDGVIELPSGRRVRGRRFGRTASAPDFGVYLLWRRPAVDWTSRWVRWPDFGLPLDDRDARAAVDEAWRRSVAERVEVSCGGGRGRTGTFLAAMAMRDGLARDDAVRWVRERYDRRAVETPWQRWWLGQDQ